MRKSEHDGFALSPSTPAGPVPNGWQPGYIGGKGQDGVWQRIIGQMPPHPVYVEAFAGSAAVFFHKRAARRSILIDASRNVIANLGATSEVTSGAGVELIHGDAIALLPRLALPPAGVVYCDPPYLLETRRGRRYYEHELTDDNHRHLLEVLRALPCRVLVSGYPSKLYGAALHDWRCLSYRVRTRGSSRTECLWMNFPEPTELHDWRFAGRTFRERLAMKRLAARWLARLQRMPPRKRGYLISTLAAANVIPGDARSDAAGSRADSDDAGLQRQVRRGAINSNEKPGEVSKSLRADPLGA